MLRRLRLCKRLPLHGHGLTNLVTPELTSSSSLVLVADRGQAAFERGFKIADIRQDPAVHPKASAFCLSITCTGRNDIIIPRRFVRPVRISRFLQGGSVFALAGV